MSRLLNELENLDEKEDVIDALKRESLPLVMWGAGETALEVNHLLEKNGIRIADIFVDDEYYSESSYFLEKAILSYSMLVKKYKSVNVILGATNYEKGETLKNKKGINKVFSFFSVTYGVYKKTPVSYIKDRIDEFETAYQLFEDDISKNNYLAFLKTRVSGNNQYVLDLYQKECNFFNNDIFHISSEEVLLDVGAFDGDTIRLFVRENKGSYRCIYALEPDEVNRNKLKQYIREAGLHDVIVTEKGAWNKKERLYFEACNEQISGVITGKGNNTAENIIEAEPLDDMFSYTEKVSILKINYFEGVKEAIEGARNILQVHKPKLAVTVGFDCRNIRYVPILLKQINPDYKLYLRYNRGMVSACTLYGLT